MRIIDPASQKDAANRPRPHLDTATNGKIVWRNAGLRHEVLCSGPCKGAVPEAGAPVAVSRSANRPTRPTLTLSEVKFGVRTIAVLFVALGLLLGLAPSAVAVPVDAAAATDTTLSGGTLTQADGLAISPALDRDTKAERANGHEQVIDAAHGNQVQLHSIPTKKAGKLQVPDGGNTAVLLGIALVCLSRLRAKFKF